MEGAGAKPHTCVAPDVPNNFVAPGCADLETHKGAADAGDIISILDQRTEAAGNRCRQTVLLSATLHSNLGALATLSLTQPVSVGIK